VRSGAGAKVRAAAALVAGVVGLVVLIVAMVSAPGLMLLAAASGAALLNGAAIALTTRHRPRRVAAAIVAAAAAVALLGAVSWWIARPAEDLPVALAVAALAAAVVLARSALHPPPAFDPKALETPRARWPAQEPVLIVNRWSGDGKAERFELVQRCRTLGIRTILLERDDDLTHLAEAAVASGAGALGMAGGDGSLGFVASVALAHDLPFVCVPSGTRNHFALDLGLDRTDPVRALAAFTAGEERRVDVASVGDRLFLNNVSLGLYAAAVSRPEYRERKLDAVLAVLPAAIEEGGPCFDLTFDLPDGTTWDTAAVLLVSNGVYEVSPRRAVGRRKHLDRGRLGVIALQADTALALGTLSALTAAGIPDRAGGLMTWETDHFAVSSPHDELDVGIDGEAVRLPTPLEFAVQPRALRVLVPPGAHVGLAAQDRGAEGPIGGLLGVILDPVS
jgi:diacylglycerol kinase family enzyme